MTEERRTFYCRELEELISACDPDDPSPENLSRVEEHVAACPVCGDAESALRRTVEAYRTCDPDKVNPALETTLVERLCGSSWNASERRER